MSVSITYLNGQSDDIIIMWASGKEHFQGTMPRVILEISQTPMTRGITQIRSDRKQETSLGRESMKLLILEKAARK